jgi:phenylpropionate dioxygenase-like ring-hydroxylating dioxygenase large terminal subunit
LCEQRFGREKALFRTLPLLVAHSSEVSQPGDYVVRELDGTSWLLVRGDDGVVRGFYNYCQHRGTKLVHDQMGCTRRFVCPYHAWTYGVKGNLLGVPRADLFPGLDKSQLSLKSVDVEEAHGFVWLTQVASEKRSIYDYLGGLNTEFEELGLANYQVYFDKIRTLKANWKLPIFAFLESYHISTLHRDSIAEFFIENIAFSEQFGPHIRSFVPRTNVLDLQTANLEEVQIAEYITPTNIVFPNVCMIAHPTSYSVISMFPGASPAESLWRHVLLVPELPVSDAQKAHYDKTIKVLDETTYQNEDFWVSEQIQEGINAGAINELLLAKNELMLKVFNDTVNDWANATP